MSRLIKNSFAESMQASVSGDTQPKKVNTPKEEQEPVVKETKKTVKPTAKKENTTTKPVLKIKKKEVVKKKSDTSREGDVKKSISLPTELFKKIRLESIENDISMRDYMVHALGQATGCSEEQIEEWTKTVKGVRG